MICRTCLRRAAGFATRQIAPRSLSVTAPARTFSTTLCTRNAAPAVAGATPSAESRAPDLTPLTPSSSAASEAAAAAEKPRPISICAAGTPLNGLNYFKGRSDPVALPDEAYPDWLWNCLEVQKKADAADDADAGDEFSKSKKQRRLALKRQRQQEEKILASGNLEALAPKIPLQQQSINLPAGEPGNVRAAIEAADKREELRRAMRKERRAKIKESNFLRSM